MPDPETAPLVRELFERRAAGAGPSELSDWLHSLGATTAYGRKRFSHRAIKDILRNDVYIGVASAGPRIRNEQAHEPLIDHATLRRCNGTEFSSGHDRTPHRPSAHC